MANKWRRSGKKTWKYWQRRGMPIVFLSTHVGENIFQQYVDRSRRFQHASLVSEEALASFAKAVEAFHQVGAAASGVMERMHHLTQEVWAVHHEMQAQGIESPSCIPLRQHTPLKAWLEVREEVLSINPSSGRILSSEITISEPLGDVVPSAERRRAFREIEQTLSPRALSELAPRHVLLRIDIGEGQDCSTSYICDVERASGTYNGQSYNRIARNPQLISVALPNSIDDSTCKYFNGGSYLRCAVNTAGPCEGCKDYQEFDS